MGVFETLTLIKGLCLYEILYSFEQLFRNLVFFRYLMSVKSFDGSKERSNLWSNLFLTEMIYSKWWHFCPFIIFCLSCDEKAFILADLLVIDQYFDIIHQIFMLSNLFMAYSIKRLQTWRNNSYVFLTLPYFMVPLNLFHSFLKLDLLYYSHFFLTLLQLIKLSDA